jgi:hypothetical protein
MSAHALPSASVVVARRTVTGVADGVWVRALATRLPSTWRSRASSPTTTGAVSDDQQIDGLLLERPLLVEPGQQQQVLDEQAHPGGLLLDPTHHAAQVFGGADRALPVQLGKAADRGQRGPQLMARVGDEPAHPVLGLLCAGLGRLALSEGGLDLSEHAVERRRQSAHLGVWVTFVHPP